MKLDNAEAITRQLKNSPYNLSHSDEGLVDSLMSIEIPEKHGFYLPSNNGLEISSPGVYFHLRGILDHKKVRTLTKSNSLSLDRVTPPCIGEFSIENLINMIQGEEVLDKMFKQCTRNGYEFSAIGITTQTSYMPNKGPAILKRTIIRPTLLIPGTTSARSGPIHAFERRFEQYPQTSV